MRSLRVILLSLLVAGSLWFEFAQPLTAKALAHRAMGVFDRRPVRHILILGNSRTCYNDMPEMVYAMADAAGSPQRFEITLDAPPGASFEILWKDAATQRLLGERWDDVILQPESRAQASGENKQSFQSYGARLIGAAQVVAGSPKLVVNWNYDAKMWKHDPDGQGWSAYYADTQFNSAALADRAGAKLINVGRLWAGIIADHPEIKLTQDGNHPTLAGSYMFALMLYGDLSGRDVGTIAYVPDGLDIQVADTLRRAVRDYRASAS